MSFFLEKPSGLGWLERFLLIGCVLAALVFGLVGIGRFLRPDEANSVLIASSNFGRLIEYIRSDNNLPLYYVLLHGWIRLWGISETAVHFPSMLCYFAAILFVYRLGWDAFGNRQAALYSAFFYLVSRQAIHHAQTARMYSLMGMIAALSTLFFIRICSGEEIRRNDWIWFAIVNTLGVFVHVWYFFLIFGEGVATLFIRPKKVRAVAASMATSLVPFLLLWGSSLVHQAKLGAGDWMPFARRSFFVAVFSEFYGGMKWGSLLLAGAAVICLMGATEKQIREWLGQRVFLLLALIALTSVMVPLVISFVRPIYFPGRYTMIALPALAALLGGSVARLARPVVGAVFAFAVLLAVVIFHVRTRTEVFENSVNAYTEAESDKHAVLELCPRMSPGDTLLFTGLSRVGVEYYLRRLDCGRDIVLASFPKDTADHMGWVRNNDTPALQQQAQDWARQFSEDRLDHRLWVTLAPGRENDKRILAYTLGSSLAVEETLPLKGSFFSGIVVYGRRGGIEHANIPEPISPK